jgi:CheY-like chemotaxis protein
MRVSTGSPGAHPAQVIAPLLVVDDDPAGSAETGAILAAEGYEIATLSDGDEVLRLVRASLMRMVVSELYIRCSDGPCVVTALKQDRSRLPRLRVLVHTRHTAPRDVEWALAAGADTIVNKPSQNGALAREVARLLGGTA